MDLLLDSHVAVWWADDPQLLSEQARTAIASSANVVWFSAASAWELSIKVRSGKLAVDVAGLARGLAHDGIRLLGVGIDDGIAAGALDWAHRDPFDRMLVAQAIRQDLSLVTRDALIVDFPTVSTIVA